MIIHDYEGTRIACGIIAPCTEIVNAFVKYFNYEGDLEVSGAIQVLGSGVGPTAAQTLSWKLEGVDPECATAPPANANPNACGIHIHVGMSCTENAGGHYWNNDYLNADPWTVVKYKTWTRGDSSYSMAWNQKVVTGYNNFDTLGHTMIVHDHTGARVACGIINIAS